jgi:hypothetical protein
VRGEQIEGGQVFSRTFVTFVVLWLGEGRCTQTEGPGVRR